MHAPRVDALVQVSQDEWLACTDPARIVRADTADGVGAAFEDVERLTRDYGFHAVGVVAFEAARAFDLAVRPAPAELPLAWFALFEPSHVRRVPPPARSHADADYQIGDLTPTLDRESFRRAFERIRDHLAAGDTYQVNLTFALTAAFVGDPQTFFADLVAAQQGRCSAFLRLGDWTICSASPELFFAIDGLTISSRPMKGTAPRGRTLEEDAQRREDLHLSPKQRAENVMVVDMVRNDLGRIAQVGSVEVPELFTVERYPNVWQMTSLVKARSTAPLAAIFAALHPCASITGAPKVRTMEILRDLEAGPRGIYTGAIGHVCPDGNASFNVAIRTAVIDHRTGTLSFGIGSGIVWDSDADAEYDECLMKASVLRSRPERFDLLETLRWSPDEGFLLLDRHLARLAATAEYFGRRCDVDEVRAALNESVREAAAPQRIRLLVSEDGRPRVESHVFEPDTRVLDVALASEPVDISNRFLFHKTTNRSVYERLRVADAAETILWNRDREITEAITANVVIELEGRRVTPPIACGLLAGTARAELLQQGAISEQTISIEALHRAARVWLINSVQGWREARVRNRARGAGAVS